MQDISKTKLQEFWLKKETSYCLNRKLCVAINDDILPVLCYARKLWKTSKQQNARHILAGKVKKYWELTNENVNMVLYTQQNAVFCELKKGVGFIGGKYTDV